MRQNIDPANALEYPANIQAILKRQAPCSAWLNQSILEIDSEIARLKLATMGIEIDTLSEEQAKYLASWDEGT